MDKLINWCKEYKLTDEEMHGIFETPLCPMYGLINLLIEKRFTAHCSRQSEYITKYSLDDECVRLGEALEELFVMAGYRDGDFYLTVESLFDSPAYETGYCAIAWISKKTNSLETLNFQWESM